MTFGCGPSHLSGCTCNSANLVITLALVVLCLWWTCVQSVPLALLPRMGMVVRPGQEWHSCGIRKPGGGNREKLWAGVRETAPGAAHEGLLLWALQSAIAALLRPTPEFQAMGVGGGRGKRPWGCAGPFHVWMSAWVPSIMTEAKAGFLYQQFHF